MGIGAAAAGIGAVGAIGAAAVSSGKGSGGSSSGTSSNQPWAQQQPYMVNGYQNADQTFLQNQAQGPYQGLFTAQNNGVQGNAITNAANYNTGAGNVLPNQTAATSSMLQGAGGAYVNNAGYMAANGAGQSSPLAGVLSGYATGQMPANTSINPQLNGALTQAGISGANSLNGFTQDQQNVVNQSLADPTQQLISQAGQYMNSAPVQGAISNTNAQINQQLNEQTVPQLNREASMGGALNSSRAGMAEGMANENAAIATGNADSSILNNAYNTGLNTAATERNAGLTTAMYGANSGLVDNNSVAQGQNAALTGQGQFNTNTALSAAGTGVNYALGEQGLNANTQLAANAQLGNATNMGIQGGTAAGNQAAINFALGSGAGALQQAGDQANITNAYDQYQTNQQQPYQNLDNYWSIVGNPNGTQGTTSGQQQIAPNYIGNALGGASAGAGLFGQGGLFGANSGGTMPGGGVSGQVAPGYVDNGSYV